MRKEYKDKNLSSEIEESPILQFPTETSYFGLPVCFNKPSDPKILRRFELLQLVFNSRVFCEYMMNYPHISTSDHKKLKLLDENLKKLDETIYEMINSEFEDVPPMVSGCKGAKFNKTTYKWYFEYNDENVKELSKRLNKFINKTNEYQKYDHKLKKINTKELQLFSEKST